jgi:hypothetical protein
MNPAFIGLIIFLFAVGYVLFILFMFGAFKVSAKGDRDAEKRNKQYYNPLDPANRRDAGDGVQPTITHSGRTIDLTGDPETPDDTDT